MIRNKCTVALLLVCLMATLADAQDVRPTQDPPLVTFNDLKNGDLVEGPFRIEGFARLLASLVAKDAVILVPALKKYLKK